MRETLGWIDREMSAPEGGFHSATDADSLTPSGEAEEGWFFTWTPGEIAAVLTPDEAARVTARYGVTAGGNFEGRNVLHLAGGPGETRGAASRVALDKLLAARARRPAPLRDDKVLASWNGLAISAFARAGFAFDEASWIDRSRRAARFVLEKMRRDGRLSRSFKDGTASNPAVLDDYAFTIAGLLDLFEATGEPVWLREALALQATLDRHYADGAGGGYFRTADDGERLLTREKPFDDSAEPSGNAIALANLLRLEALTTDDRFRAAADALLRAASGTLVRAPELMLGLELRHAAPQEIVIVAPQGDAGLASPLVDALRRSFVPDRVLVVATEQRIGELAPLVPPTAGKRAIDGRATAFVCRRGVCAQPVFTPADLLRQLRRPGPAA